MRTTETLVNMDGLYPASQLVMGDATLQAYFCRLDAHQEDGAPDRLWLEYTPDDDFCEGEYISLEQDDNVCYVDHGSADTVGGDPTFWSYHGSVDDALKALAHYLLNSRFN